MIPSQIVLFYFMVSWVVINDSVLCRHRYSFCMFDFMCRIFCPVTPLNLYYSVMTFTFELGRVSVFLVMIGTLLPI